MGKGSKRRPEDRKAVGHNWDTIEWKRGNPRRERKVDSKSSHKKVNIP